MSCHVGNEKSVNPLIDVYPSSSYWKASVKPRSKKMASVSTSSTVSFGCDVSTITPGTSETQRTTPKTCEHPARHNEYRNSELRNYDVIKNRLFLHSL
ncbi:hypothetical protein PsorP6_011313 [Peronosclerospora sorghi]|uniref:Uncharacterized protein n=1 Tax=Peronosclerospora sorghi TaxID=230839 RepID=A0ACC0WJC8_9STRA|nr:hypothetical protein PsorP6_011313 [Peronosclerospora sorghi]